MIFECLLVELPEEPKDGEVQKNHERIITEGVELLPAKNEGSAAMQMTVKYAELLSKLEPDRISVIVRPFAGRG